MANAGRQCPPQIKAYWGGFAFSDFLNVESLGEQSFFKKQFQLSQSPGDLLFGEFGLWCHNRILLLPL